MNTIEWTRKNTSMGCIENIGMMKFKGKRNSANTRTFNRVLSSISRTMFIKFSHQRQ